MERKSKELRRKLMTSNKRKREIDGDSSDLKLNMLKLPKFSLEGFHALNWEATILAGGPDGSGDHVSYENTERTMRERYCKVTSIGNYDGPDPVSYCYIDDCEKPPRPEDHFKIIYWHVDIKSDKDQEPVLPSWCKNAWKSLPSPIKHELLCIQSTFRALWEKIEYKLETSSWQIRTTPISGDLATGRLDLESYGDPDPSGKSFMELLLGDTPWEDVWKEFYCKSPASSVLSRVRKELIVLGKLWTKGLLKNMTNGVAIHVVMRTLELIASLVEYLPESMAPNHCLPLTIELICSTTTDSLSVSECDSKSSTRSDSTSSLDSPSESEKNRSYCNCQNCQSQHEAAGKTSACKSDRGKNSESKCSKTSKLNDGKPKRSVDLEVICIDEKKAEGKYILLVEICSGDGYNTALGKFRKELVHVLQSQSEVFGLFISENRFQMFRAMRDFTNGTITIMSTPYYMHTQHFAKPAQEVKIEAFQRFVMDMFSCFVYGISHIET